MARRADGVNLINKNDARGAFFGRIKQIAHASRPHTNIHLLELGSRSVEEGHAGFSRYRSRE